MRTSLMADYFNRAEQRFAWLILPDLLRELGFSPADAGREIVRRVQSIRPWFYAF